MLVVEVEDGIVGGDEDITKNPSRAHRGVQVQTHETRDAGSTGVKNIVLTSQIEVAARDDEGDNGEGVDSVARSKDALTLEVGPATELRVDLVDLVSGTGDQRGSGVTDGADTRERRVTGTDVLASNQNVVDVDGPVGLREERSIGDDTSVLGVVDTTEDQLTTGAVVGVLGQPEGENVLVNELLVHDVVPDGGDRVDRDGLESKTEDTIKLGSNEGDSGLGGGLSEGLAGDVEVGETEGILSEETGEPASTVLNLEVLAVGDGGGGGSAVVLVVSLTRDVTTTTGGGRNPKVGGTGIEDNGEGLRGSSKRNGTIVLGVTHIDELDGVGVVLDTISVTDSVNTSGHLHVALRGSHGDPDEVGAACRHEKGEKEVLHVVCRKQKSNHNKKKRFWLFLFKPLIVVQEMGRIFVRKRKGKFRVISMNFVSIIPLWTFWGKSAHPQRQGRWEKRKKEHWRDKEIEKAMKKEERVEKENK